MGGKRLKPKKKPGPKHIKVSLELSDGKRIDFEVRKPELVALVKEHAKKEGVCLEDAAVTVVEGLLARSSLAGELAATTAGEGGQQPPGARRAGGAGS